MLKKKKEPINVCGKDNNVRWNTETNDISVDCFGDTYSLPELIKVAYNGSLEELKDTWARVLVKFELPPMVEELFVAAYKNFVREQREHEDKVKKKLELLK